MSGNNVIIGANAELPVGVTQDAVVLGSAASTVYLAGGAMQASATALTLTTPLIAGGSAGTAGQILKSTGGGIEWAAASTAPAAALSFGGDTTASSANSVYILTGTSAAVLSLPAINTLVGVPLTVKNQSTAVLTVSGAALVAPASTAVIATAPIASGGSCQIVSDGTNWLMLDAAGAPPTTPIAPDTVAIATPASGSAPATLTVTYYVRARTTSLLVQIAQGVIGDSPVYVGAASALASGTGALMSVVVPAAAGTYNTASTVPFRAYVTPFNGWAPGPFNNSITYTFNSPTNVTIATPTGTSAIVGLNVAWTAPPFTPDSNMVEILVGGVVQYTLYSIAGGASTATVPNVRINTAAAISARVTAYKDAVGYVGSDSSGYTWSTPSSVFANRQNIGDNIVQIIGNWTLAYGVSNYQYVNIVLIQYLNVLPQPPPQVVYNVNADINTTTFTSPPLPSYLEEGFYLYDYGITYYNQWEGYNASAGSNRV